MSDEQPNKSCSPRSQIVIYFPSEPQIDYVKLCDFLNSCDPAEKDKFVLEADKPPFGANPALAGQDVRLSGAVLSLNLYKFMILGHSVPDPDRDVLELPRVPAPMREALKKHTGFVLVSLFGGEEYGPVERIVVLMKVAIGMFAQGGIGISIPAFRMAYTAEFIQMLAQAPGKLVPGATLWKVMREDGEPIDLLSSIAVTEKDGVKWMHSLGHVVYGLPDFAYRVSDNADFKEMRGTFQMVLRYLLEKGPVIAAGHTMGVDERAAIRFAAPTTEEQWLAGENDLLIINRETTVKKGFLARIFGW